MTAGTREPGAFFPPFETAAFALVAAATAWPVTAERAAQVRMLAGRVADWEAVLSLVDRHRVAGLVQHVLSGAAVPLPEPIRTELSARARENAVRELRYLSETVRLAGLFEGAGIVTRVIKGVTTAKAAFGRFGVRYSMDIDLIVRPADVAAGSALLRSLGYVRIEPVEEASPAELRARCDRFKDMVFEHRVSGCVVELHWRLFQNRRLLPLDLAGSGDRLELLSGATVPVLPPDDALLYLCVHGAEHGWARLKWLADLGALLTTDPAAADRVYRRARSTGLRRLVGPGLALSQRLYGTALPDDVERDLARDRRMRWLARIAWTTLVGDESGAELEARALGTARKNLSHYFFSNDPRAWWNEFRFDVLDSGGDREQHRSGLRTRAARLIALAGNAVRPQKP